MLKNNDSLLDLSKEELIRRIYSGEVEIEILQNELRRAKTASRPALQPASQPAPNVLFDLYNQDETEAGHDVETTENQENSKKAKKTKKEKRKHGKHSTRKRILVFIAVLVVIASVIAALNIMLFPVYIIKNSTVSPTIKDNETVIFIKKSNIESGDIIAFRHGNMVLVKRVIAVGGDGVEIAEDGTVTLNGVLLEEQYVTEHGGRTEADSGSLIQVPEGCYFVMGDNRLTSVDSRHAEIGFIDSSNVIGESLVIVWPLNRLGLFS